MSCGYDEKNGACIWRGSVYDVFVHGPDRRKHVVSAECSTPKAKAFIDALLSSPLFDVEECSVSSRELRGLITADGLAEITRPMVEPVPDIIEDLWQLSHVTGHTSADRRRRDTARRRHYSYSSISIVVAALFLPFLSQVLAVGFGVWCAALCSRAQCWPMSRGSGRAADRRPDRISGFRGAGCELRHFRRDRGCGRFVDCGRCRKALSHRRRCRHPVRYFPRLVRRGQSSAFHPVSGGWPDQHVHCERGHHFWSSRYILCATGSSKGRDAPIYIPPRWSKPRSPE